jgi:hypothetical protein
VLGQMDGRLGTLGDGWPELFLVPADLFGRTDLDDVADLPGVRLLQREAFFGAWMPDSSAVALILDDGSIDVVTIADGQRRTLIEDGGLGAAAGGSFLGVSASWSPDGRRMAISLIDGATDPDFSIDVVTIADGQRRTLSEHADPPSWSPDGSHIAYLECPAVGDLLPLDTVPADMAAVDPRQPDGVVWVAAADGTSARPVATSLEAPIWSPDGSVLIAVGEDGLFMVRPDGTGMTRLTQVMTPVDPYVGSACGGTHSFAPVWQPVPPSAETVADAVLPPVRVETTEPPATTEPSAITDG